MLRDYEGHGVEASEFVTLGVDESKDVMPCLRILIREKRA